MRRLSSSSCSLSGRAASPCSTMLRAVSNCPWLTRLPAACASSPAVSGGRLNSTQWTQVILGARGSGASGSSTIRTRLCASHGTPDQLSGGEVSLPSQVYSRGISPPSTKALDTIASAMQTSRPGHTIGVEFSAQRGWVGDGGRRTSRCVARLRRSRMARQRHLRPRPVAAQLARGHP